MVPGADDKVNLRAANGHFLSVDSVGTVACPSEARGPQEEFQILKHPSLEGRYLLRSVLYGGIIVGLPPLSLSPYDPVYLNHD